LYLGAICHPWWLCLEAAQHPGRDQDWDRQHNNDTLSVPSAEGEAAPVTVGYG